MQIIGTSNIVGVLVIEIDDPFLRSFQSFAIRAGQTLEVSDHFRFSPGLVQAEALNLVTIQLDPDDEAVQSDLGGSGGSGGSGASGFSGYSGYSGFSGTTGVTGAGGLSGYSGFSGAQGATGSTGASGASGFSGYSGLSGYSGYSGSSGFSGFSGVSGYSGFSGTSGTGGFSGYSGYSGFSGLSGYSGFFGASGYSGYSGTSGTSGYSGVGTSGYSGFSGFSGATGINTYSSTFNGTSDWGSASAGEYTITFTHDLNSLNLVVMVWNTTSTPTVTIPDVVQAPSTNTVSISVGSSPDGRFPGTCLIIAL